MIKMISSLVSSVTKDHRKKNKFHSDSQEIAYWPSTLRKWRISSTTSWVAWPHACLKLLKVLSKLFRCLTHFWTQDCSIGSSKCVIANMEKCGPGTVDIERRISNRRSIVCAWNRLGQVPMALVRPSRSRNHTRRIPVSSMAVMDFAVDEKTLSSESEPRTRSVLITETKWTNGIENKVCRDKIKRFCSDQHLNHW